MESVKFSTNKTRRENGRLTAVQQHFSSPLRKLIQQSSMFTVRVRNMVLLKAIFRLLKVSNRINFTKRTGRPY